ncbi:MAG TPA: hypothetical protein VFZ98_09285 [Vicinamibacterales bacterium]
MTGNITKGMTLSSVLASLFVLGPAVAFAQTAPQIQATSTVDRTAIWIADRVTYSIDLLCAPGVDVLLDDLSKEKLRLNGLEFVSADTSQTTDAQGRTTHRLRYLLTTYRVDAPSPSIEAPSVRYYVRKAGQRLQDVAPAGEIRVPGAVLAFRSTLPEGQEYHLRDVRTLTPRNWFAARTRQFGLAAVILSLAPAVVVVAGAVRRRTAAVSSRPSKRRTRADQRAALERLRTMDVSTEEDRRRAYDEISAAVRAHVATHTHVPATALTADELEHALSSGRSRIPHESVSSLLAASDSARYAPPEAMPPAEQCRDALRTAEQVLEA